MGYELKPKITIGTNNSGTRIEVTFDYTAEIMEDYAAQASKQIDEAVFDLIAQMRGYSRCSVDVLKLRALVDALEHANDQECGSCPFRSYCETHNDATCSEVRAWHTADVVREAIGYEKR